MKRNLIYLFSVVMLLGLLPLKASAQAVQPTVMVMPEVNSEVSKNPEQLRAYLEANPLLELSVSRVKEMFTTRNFPVKDFAKSLSLMKTNAIVSAAKGADNNVLKSIAESSQADICIYVKPRVINHGSMSEVVLVLDAQEAKLGDSFANASFSSDKFQTTDSVKLANRALDAISNNFFYQIEDGFAQMVKEGRKMSFRIEFEQGCEIDAYTEVGENGIDLTGELDEYAAKKSGKVTTSSDKLIEMFIRVPVYDEDGSAYPIGRERSRLQSQLNKWLRPLGYKGKTVLSRDQAIHFMISNKEE